MRTITGIIVAAIVMFMWGAFFWTQGIPEGTLLPISDNAATQEMLDEHFPEAGMYFVPWADDPTSGEWIAAHERGPIAMVAVSPGGPPQTGLGMAKGFAIELASAALIAWLLSLAAPSLPAYGQRVIFVCIAGATAVLLTRAKSMVWFYSPASWEIPGAAYDFIGWMLAGLVLAWFIRPVTK